MNRGEGPVVNETAEEERNGPTRKVRRHKCGVDADGDEEAGDVVLGELSVERGRETTRKKTN